MLNRLLRMVLGVTLLAGLSLLASRAYTVLAYQPRIHTAADAPASRVAIVFGAGLRRDGRASAVLYDRVATAAELFHAGKVDRLLLSGDNSHDDYNEPLAMWRTAVELGVPESALVPDYAGRRTYDTCYRAHAIFGLTEAILVTQDFHLPRALFTCEVLGVRAVGVSADRRLYREPILAFWQFRETLATAAAWWDVMIARPTPVLGQAEPI